MSTITINKENYKNLTKTKNYDKVKQEFENAVMLSLNEDLFKDGNITKDMYKQAKDMIVRCAY